MTIGLRSKSVRALGRLLSLRWFPSVHRSAPYLEASEARYYSVAGDRERQQDVDLTIAPARGSGKGFHGRSVLLTGGTSGIGLAVAKRLTSDGAGRVLILTRDAERGNKTVENIKTSTGLPDAPVSYLVADVTSHDDIEGPVASAMKQMASICISIYLRR